MITASALVLFMTLPGLALFYGDLVREKNVLFVFAMCLGCAGFVAILWWAVGYSLVFGTSFGSPFIGGTEFFFLQDVGAAPNTNHAYWVPQSVFCILPALIFKATAIEVAILTRNPKNDTLSPMGTLTIKELQAKSRQKPKTRRRSRSW